MSNYKEEVDRTERMAQRIMQNVTRITGELNRDSDINVSSLSGVYGAIRQAKDSRKRWAQGKITLSDDGGDYVYLNIKNSKLSLAFTPSLIVYSSEKNSDVIARYIKTGSSTAEVQYFAAFYSGATIKTDKINTSDEYSIYARRGRYISQTVDWIAFE